MANRKRKSSALPDTASQPRSTTPSASPNISRHKRVKRVSVTATQQLQEEAQHEDTIDVVPGQTSASKRAGKGLTVNIEKPHTPPDTLSPDVDHPPPQSSPLRSFSTAQVQYPALRSHLNEHFDAADVESSILADPIALDESIGTSLLLPPTAVVSQQATVVLPDPTHELEVQRFEEVTTSLHHDIASVQASKDILVTEVKALGFAEANASTETVLANIRATFRDARTQLNILLPQVDANSHPNGELLPLLTANLRSLLLTIGDQTQVIKDMTVVEQVHLVKQADLLQELAVLEKRKKDMTAVIHKTDLLADKRAKEVVSLEDEIRDLRDQCEKQAISIADHDVTVEALHREIDEVQEEANGLDAQLNTTRENLELFQARLTALEQDHKQRIIELKQAHNTAIDDVQEMLTDERAAREALERDDQDKAARIAELEVEIGDLNGDMDTLKARLVESKEQMDVQVDRNASLGELLDERQTFIPELEGKVEMAELKLDELMVELDELRTMANSERRQREDAETELDERNATIETLSSRVKEAGKESNQLKSKMFEIQQRHEQEISELQELHTTKQEQLDSDLLAEQKAHAAAADRADELTNVVVPELELKIQTTEKEYEDALIAKDDELIEKITIISELKASHEQSKQRADDFAQEKEREVQSLHADLDQSYVDLNDRNNLIQRLEAQGLEDARNHRDAVANANASIQDLASQLEVAQSEILTLEAQRISLEARVEHEATSLLMAQNDHADTVDDLKASIKARDHEIGKLLNEGNLAREEYKQTLREHNERIDNLEELAASRLIEVETLTTINEEVKEALVEAVKLGRQKISSVNAITAAAHIASQEEEQSLLRDTEVLLQKAEAASTTVTVTKQSDTYVPQRRSPRVSRKTAKKRVHDSGVFDVNTSEPEELTQEMQEIMAS